MHSANPQGGHTVPSIWVDYSNQPHSPVFGGRHSLDKAPHGIIQAGILRPDQIPDTQTRLAVPTGKQSSYLY